MLFGKQFEYSRPLASAGENCVAERSTATALRSLGNQDLLVPMPVLHALRAPHFFAVDCAKLH